MQIKEELIKEYRYKTELHAHARPVSHCSEFLPEALAEVYGGVGVDTLVLTNHFTPSQVDEQSKEELVRDYWDCFTDVREAAKKEGFSAVFAMEIRFRESNNDYLLYGITREDLPFLYDCVKSGMGIREFYRAFHREDVVILQAHPFRNGCEPIEGEFLDGMEVFNMHPGHNSRVAFAARRAREDGLLLSGGTDFHHPGHEGVCLMRTRQKIETPEDLVTVLREKDFLLDIGGCIILP